MKSILITGLNGFIGNSFLTFSRYKDVRKVSLKNENPENIDFTGIDAVLHLAAIVHSKAKKEEYSRINRDLSIALASSARRAGVKHFIFMSTSKVYGSFENRSAPFNEGSACKPDTDYGISKFEAEEGIKRLADGSFCVSIIRIPVVYGPGMKANMLSLMRLVRNSPFLPFGGSAGKRNYIYIENLIGFIDRIIELRIPGTFIAMDDEPVTTEDLTRYFATAMHRKIRMIKPPSFVIRLLKYTSPANHERLFGSFIMDNSNTRQKLDYYPRFTTGEGIERTICLLRK